MTFAELRKADFGKKFHSRFAGEKIPTLEEMLDIVGGMEVVNIEIKRFGGDDVKVLNRFYQILSKRGLLKNTIVSSFDRDILFELHQLHPDVCTCLLYGAPDGDMPEIALSLGCSAIHPQIEHLTQAVVDEAHAMGLKVNCWTPNIDLMLNRAVSFGCDGIITNYPDRAYAAIVRAQ